MSKKTETREIAVIKEVTWLLEPHGRIVGKMHDGIVLYEFRVGNPPTADIDVFVAICDLAVAQGMLRRIPVYAVK